MGVLCHAAPLTKCLVLLASFLAVWASADPEVGMVEVGAEGEAAPEQVEYTMDASAFVDIGANLKKLAEDAGPTADGKPPPLQLLMAAHEGNLAQVDELLGQGAPVDGALLAGVTPLFLAAQGGHIDVLTRLLQAGADISKASGHGGTSDAADEKGAPALWMASQGGYTDVAGALLQAGAKVDDARREDRATPLLVAAQNGHLETVKVLVQGGAKIDGDIRYSYTPLWMAEQEGHTEVADFLEKAKRGGRARLVRTETQEVKAKGDTETPLPVKNIPRPERGGINPAAAKKKRQVREESK